MVGREDVGTGGGPGVVDEECHVLGLAGRRLDGLVVGDVHGDRYGFRYGHLRGIAGPGVDLGRSGFEEGSYELLSESSVGARDERDGAF
ncbi:hypothetical protein RKD18_000646 [Streptomyces phaeoluteigriseus]